MPEDAERKGLGTPATRAGILEKLVSAGFLERKKNRKTVQLLPSHDAVSLITVLPEQLQSPLLTAEWEYRLGEIERGQLAPEEFLCVGDMVRGHQGLRAVQHSGGQAGRVRRLVHGRACFIQHIDAAEMCIRDRRGARKAQRSLRRAVSLYGRAGG